MDMEREVWRADAEDIREPQRKRIHREVTLKLLLIGDVMVGKTSFAQRYVNNQFPVHYKSTIGVDFFMKKIQWTEDLTVKVQIWDIAGVEQFNLLTRAYYKNAHGCILMFDLSDLTSFRRVGVWKEDLDSKCRQPDGSLLPCLLVGNKSDVPCKAVSRDDIEALGKRYNCCGWREISVLDNIGVDETVRFMVLAMLNGAGRTMSRAADEETIILKDSPPKTADISQPKHNPCSC